MAETEYSFPEGVSPSLEGNVLTVKGPKGEVNKTLSFPGISMSLDGNKLVITSEGENKKMKAILGTWKAIAAGMATGVTKGWKCTLKLVYSHFPVKLKMEGDTFVVENFLGEKQKRKIKISNDVKVEIKGNEITVTGTDKEKVGQIAALIEQKVSVKGFDRRIFQDGIYKVGRTVPAEE